MLVISHIVLCFGIGNDLVDVCYWGLRVYHKPVYLAVIIKVIRPVVLGAGLEFADVCENVSLRTSD